MSKQTELRDQYKHDEEAIVGHFQDFEEHEAMLVSRVENTMKNKSGKKSRITDSRLSTVAWERSARVMGQMVTGEVKALGGNDKGQAMLLDLILSRYIQEGDNWQHPHLTKLRLWDMYSSVYGSMFMLYDYHVTPNYVGPASFLLPIRNVTPQRGAVSMEDSDYIFVDSYHTREEIEAELKKKDSTWDKTALRAMLKRTDQKKGKKKEEERKSYIEKTRDANVDPNLFRVTTKYEAGADGKWITFDPQTGEELRTRNGHKSGRIPIVKKDNFPLIDSMYGLGDFERGKSIQKAMDQAIALYFDGIKMSIYPPSIVNPNGVIPSSLVQAPGKRWLETIPQSIRPYQVAPQGLQTFQSTYSFLTGALLNQNGTTDTTINAEKALDSGYGKTPQALEQLKARENTRDSWDRFMMEQAVEELYNGMLELVVAEQDKPIEVTLFEKEIKQIKESGYKDVENMIERKKDSKTGVVRIDKKDVKGTKFKFYVDSGSSKALSDEKQHQIYENMLLAFSKLPNLAESLAEEDYGFSFGKLLQKWAATAGTDDYDSIIYKLSEEDKKERKKEQKQAANPAQQQMSPGEAQMASRMMAQQQPQVGAANAQAGANVAQYGPQQGPIPQGPVPQGPPQGASTQIPGGQDELDPLIQQELRRLGIQ